MADRKGNRTPRSRRCGTRVPELGHYNIVTDTEETEYNYLTGLRRALPSDLQRKLTIKVIRKIQTKHLLEKALRVKSDSAQYAELWIVFDKDEVNDYDRIIEDAHRKGIRVGWSNPCIEIWFHAYLGEMPYSQNPDICCEQFNNVFLRITGRRYEKSDSKIYETLCQIGDETKAVELAKRIYHDHRDNGNCRPSDMNPATTLYALIDEIRCKCKKNNSKE